MNFWQSIWPALLLPIGAYVALPLAAFPVGALILLGPAALIVAVYQGLRYDHPSVWWFLLPMLATEVWLAIDAGWGMLIGVALEALALAWLVWANREVPWIAALTCFFCLTYGWIPVLPFLGTI